MLRGRLLVHRLHLARGTVQHVGGRLQLQPLRRLLLREAWPSYGEAGYDCIHIPRRVGCLSCCGGDRIVGHLLPFLPREKL
jgi:hypothetical protein